MYLYLLEFTYAMEDRIAVEAWLSEADVSGVLISVQQYDDEMFAVLASGLPLSEDHQKLLLDPGVTSCRARRRFLYRVTTAGASQPIFHSFPLGEDHEWYSGGEKVVYLSLPSPALARKQISWLATSPEIVGWENHFELEPVRTVPANP